MSESNQSSVRNDGLGDLCVLSDKLLLEVLGELGGKDLLQLSLVSKVWMPFERVSFGRKLMAGCFLQALYVFANVDKLWRKVCLDKYQGDFRFKKRWKYTALRPADEVLQDSDYPEALGAVEGFHSDLLYRRWYRAHMDKAQYAIDYAHIDKRSDLTYEEFVKEYLEPGKPVILTDAMRHWPSCNWTMDTFVEKYGNVPFKTNWVYWNEEKQKPKRVYMSAKDFVYYGRNQHDTDPGYIFDGDFGTERATALLNEYDRTPYFREDLFAVLGEHRPDFRWWLIGPAGSGSSFHIDPHATSAWNALLCGRKRWALYPPSMPPPGIGYKEQEFSVSFKSPKPFKWFVEVYPFLKPDQRPLEVMQEPGEIIFVPAGWWHAVCNVTETMAVTQNWVDKHNFHVAWRDLKRDGGMMATEFYERLRYVRPDLFEEYDRRQQLELARANLKTGNAKQQVSKGGEKEKEKEKQKEKEKKKKKEKNNNNNNNNNKKKKKKKKKKKP